MNKTLIAQLVQVRRLIEQGWTQGAYCRLANGAVLDTTSKMHDQPERRISYCLAGAVERIGRTMTGSEQLRRALEAELDCERGRDDGFRLERWNDGYDRDVRDVLALIDLAINRALDRQRSRNASAAA